MEHIDTLGHTGNIVAQSGIDFNGSIDQQEREHTTNKTNFKNQGTIRLKQSRKRKNVPNQSLRKGHSAPRVLSNEITWRAV